LLEVQQIMRHDFLNHIQVIYGFLQIGYSGNAKEYALRAVDSMQDYSRLGKIPLPCLQCMLTWLVTQLHNEQTSLDYSLDGDLQAWLAEDEELTRILMLLVCAVQEDLLKHNLQCSLVFEEKLAGFIISFEGTVAKTDLLKKVDVFSQRLFLELDESWPGKFIVTITKNS
jgi:hypothetical protein